MLTTRKSCEWPRCLKGWLRIAGQGRFPEGSERVCKVGPGASFPSSYLSTSRRNVEMSWGGKWKIIDNSFEISLIPLFKKFGKNQIRKIKGQACQLAPPKSLSPLQEHAEEKNASMFPLIIALCISELNGSEDQPWLWICWKERGRVRRMGYVECR